jgi:hypothetical protein
MDGSSCVRTASAAKQFPARLTSARTARISRANGPGRLPGPLLLRRAGLLANPARCRYAKAAAAIAQPVEHIIRNDGVGGSNPSCGTTA